MTKTEDAAFYFAIGRKKEPKMEHETTPASGVEYDRFECHAEIRDASEKGNTRVVQGYANTKNLDRMNEIVEPHAFRSSLQAWVKDGAILLNHDTDKPLGRPLEGTIDENGLKIKAEIARDIEYAEDAWKLIKQKVLRAFSIGYKVLKDKVEEVSKENDPEGVGKRVRRILDLELYEVSVVTIPANRESLFSVTKGLQFGTDMFQPCAAVPTKDADVSPDRESLKEFVARLIEEAQDRTLQRELDAINQKIREHLG